MLNFIRKTVNFSRKSGGPNVLHTSVDISAANPTDKTRILLALTGFDIRFSDKDHHLKRVLLRPELDEHGPFGKSVDIRVELGIRDNSGNWDDPYEGDVDLALIVVNDADIEVDCDQSDVYTSDVNKGPLSRTTMHQAHVANMEHIALLRGFDIGFTGDDHHLMQLEASARATTASTGSTMFDAVNTTLGLRDGSGFWDDEYGGTIDFSLLRYPTGLLSVHESSALRVTGKNSGPKDTAVTYYSPAEITANDVLVGMTGFQLGYTGGDRHVYRMVSRLTNTVALADGKTKINVKYTGGLRDKSGNWDDAYDCTGQYMVMVRNKEIAVADSHPKAQPIMLRDGRVRKFIPAPVLLDRK